MPAQTGARQTLRSSADFRSGNTFARYSKLMWQERISHYLLAGDEEQDPDFREELLRLSQVGVRVAGAAEIAVTLFMVGANYVLDRNPEMLASRLYLAVWMVVLGLLTLGAAQVRALYPYSRLTACFSGLAGMSILTWFTIRMSQYVHSIGDFVPGNVTLIMLVLVASLPLRPLQTLFVGSAMECTYVITALAAHATFDTPVGVSIINVVFIFMLTCLTTALSAVLYAQRVSSWQLHVQSLQAAENLRQAETRNLLAENAASVGRLAAALSHELNSPIGVLGSAVDTLLLLASRQAMCAGPEQQRMVVVQNDLRRSIRESADRLKQIVARMQRFTNLDRAEVQPANVNEILNDVTMLLEPNYAGRAKVELSLQPVSELMCRPQQLSAVFSNLLGNAVEATNGNGCVHVTTRENEGHVEVEIKDNGRGLDNDQLRSIFDPGFKVTNGRVTTGNWSMFSSRQIIREHGGEILISSEPGQGTAVRITLPLDGQPRT